MGEKNLNELFGSPEILIGHSLYDMEPFKVVESSIELDGMLVRGKMLAVPLHIKPQCIKSEFPIGNIAPIIGFDEALEPSRCSLVIQGKPIINKPRNIKYPNKKRARRIWKKWAKRYGTMPGKMIFIPNVEINCNPGEIHVTAKPINQE